RGLWQGDRRRPAAGVAAVGRSGDMADAMGDRVAVARPQRAHAGRDRTRDAGWRRSGVQMHVAGHAATRLYELVEQADLDAAGQGRLPPRRAVARDLYAPRCSRRSADRIDPSASMTTPSRRVRV